jgi:hypothetical protein
MKAKIQDKAKPKAMPNRELRIDGAFILPALGNLVAIPAAANSDLFDKWAPESLEILRVDDLSWGDEISGIEETWSRVQDIWLRLGRHPGMACTTAFDPAQGDGLVSFRVQSSAQDREGKLLLKVAGHSRTYLWCEHGRQGSLVSNISWCGDTLEIELTKFHQLRAWMGVNCVRMQLQTVMSRLHDLEALQR